MLISDIVNVENGIVFFVNEGIEKTILLQESADEWYDSFHKSTILDVLLKRKRQNKYAGTKSFCIDGCAYIKLYGKGCEYCFEMSVNEANLSECMKEWDALNIKLNNQGYWLLDWV